MKLFTIFMDNMSAHEPYEVMSLWSTRERAEAEIERLQKEVYVHGNPPQAFFLSTVETDTPYNDGIENASLLMARYPPYE